MSTTTPTHGREDQQGSDGVDFYNPGHNPAHHDYLSKFENNPSARQQETDDLNRQFHSSSAPDASYGLNAVRQKENEGTGTPHIPNPHKQVVRKKNNTHEPGKNALQQFLKGKKLKGKSSLLALLFVIFGGGSALTIFFSPSLAIINMKEVLTQNLNDQLHAVDERSTMLLKSKLKDTTKGSCSVIKIQCRFATMTDKQVAKFKAAGVEIKTTPKEERKWFNRNRGQITEINYMNSDGVTVIKSASELHDNLLNNTSFRSAMIKGYNPLFASLTDKVALGFMKKVKATKGMVATGENDEERQKKADAFVSTGETPDAKSITIKKDEDGKELYYDSDGNELTKEEVDAATEQSKRIAEYSKNGGASAVLKNAAKGASIVGYMDSACTVYNAFRLVSGMAKVQKEAMAIRHGMVTVFTPADASKAGDIKPGDLEYSGNTLMSIRPTEQVLDTSKIHSGSNASTPPTITDPEAGFNAMDGPGYRMAANGEAVDLSPRASRFMIGGGSVAILDGILKGVAAIVNGGDPNPQQVSEKCGWIQNPVVRITGLAIGIVAGVGTFGLSTAVGIGGSVAIGLALPFLEAQAADMLTGDGYKGLKNVDAGDFAVVGAVALFGGIAKNRGMKPLSADEGMKYAVASQATKSRYIESQQYLARATPFDVKNPYSFLGSLASTITPALQRSKTSASMAMMNIANFIPTSFASLIKPAGAAARTLDADYYKKCNDQGYALLGLGADSFCGVHYGESEENLKIPTEVITQWMYINGEIDGDSETGEAKDNGQAWNYVKWIKECPNRTLGWGENQDENQGNGWECVNPANEMKNKYYRLYHIDKSVDASLDGEPIASAGTSSPSNDQKVTDTGWSFPTVNSATITSGFETNSRPDHHGVDLALRSSSETFGQPIYAARSGEVIAAGSANGYGNWIVIKHDIDGKIYSTVYGHMEDDGVLVKVGDVVEAGKQIGKIGNKGRSTGPHLHFEIWEGTPMGGGGKQIDPTPIIESARRPSNNPTDGAINV